MSCTFSGGGLSGIVGLNAMFSIQLMVPINVFRDRCHKFDEKKTEIQLSKIATIIVLDTTF
jgi:hypothetical protein